MLDGALRKYLDGLVASSRRTRGNVLIRFFRFCGVSPSEAVEWQRGNAGDYRFVDLAYRWLDRGGLTTGSKRTQMGAVRGFFLANRCPLPQDKHWFKSEKAPVVGDLSVEEFVKIVTASNLTYRAAFLCMFQSGSGVGELCYLNEHYAEVVFDEVQKGNRVVRFSLPGRKRRKNVFPYYSFLGNDAIVALRQHFHSNGWKRDTVLFRTEQGKVLQRHNLQAYFKSMGLRLGLIKRKTPACPECGGETVWKRRIIRGTDKVGYVCTGCHKIFCLEDFGLGKRDFGGVRYRLRTHEIRDLFRTEWHRAQTYADADGTCAEFFMGHTVDPLKYDKIMRDKKYALEQYRKALPYLNILSENPRKVDRVDVESQLEASRVREEAMSEKVVKLERDIAEIRAALDYRFDLKKHRK